jgi:hypothetical protein
MKKKYIVFGLFTVSSAFGFSQPIIHACPKKKISKSSIQIVYAQYLQNGNHSAITGGTGTEKLQVYAPELSLQLEVDSLNSYSVDAGIDVISSASMDNIDFVKSSASKLSNRAYLTAGYERKGNKNRNLSFGGKGYFSIESAYLSLGGTLSLNSVSNDKSREFSAELEGYFDDLRWGRLNGERPLQLVYPAELRYRQWFDIYRRESYNLNLSWQQTIDQRMVLAFLPGLSYQQGLLSTPYHRVFFRDSSLKVENIPRTRLKIPLGVQLNSFIADRYILRTYYRFYWDDFGIRAHTVSLELAAKISPAFTLMPLLRWYSQTAASFFRPYREADLDQVFYSSDYDLSAFSSYEAGIEAQFAGFGNAGHPIHLNSLGLRYSFYKRSDGLYAHMLTMLLDLYTRKKDRLR